MKVWRQSGLTMCLSDNPWHVALHSSQSWSTSDVISGFKSTSHMRRTTKKLDSPTKCPYCILSRTDNMVFVRSKVNVRMKSNFVTKGVCFEGKYILKSESVNNALNEAQLRSWFMTGSRGAGVSWEKNWPKSTQWTRNFFPSPFNHWRLCSSVSYSHFIHFIIRRQWFYVGELQLWKQNPRNVKHRNQK